MRSQRGKILLIVGGGVTLVIIAAIAAFLIFDVNKFKSNIETAASDATGLEVRINGKMELSFFPFGVSAKDIHVAGKGGEIIALEKLKLGAELLPLLKKHLKVTSCELVSPVVTIVKEADGNYNFLSSGKKSTKVEPGAVFSLHDLKLSKGVLVYLDRKSGGKTEFKDFNLALKDISMAGNDIKNASFTGSFDCKEVQQKGFRSLNLRAAVNAVKGIYSLDPLAIGALDYVDKKTGDKTALKEINLVIKDLAVANPSGITLQNISCTGNLDCKEVRKRDLKIANIKGPIKVAKGVIRLAPFTLDIFDAKGEGDATLDKSQADAVYKINVKVAKLDFAKLEESFGAKKVIGGKGDLYAALTINEKGSRNLLRGLEGTFSLRGNNLVIFTMDLDKVLSSYETSQTFNLVDLGAFFIAGPLSNVVLKGYRYGDLYYQARGGEGTIKQFISSWKIKGGVADATDCALATHHNRVALKGKLDLVSKRYENVIVALLDGKGCAKFKQSITGPIDSPRIGAVSAIESLAEPVFNLFRKAKRFVRGGACEVFYNGAVQQPSQ